MNEATPLYRFSYAETRRRMNIGQLYVDFGQGLDQLERERMEGKERVNAYNLTSAYDLEKRASMLSEIFQSCGRKVWIEPPLFVAYGTHTTIGDNCWFNTGATLIDDGLIIIGKSVLLGPHVTISTAGHPIDPYVRESSAQFSATVTIGDRVWIGANATILPGVTVGDGSVIAAGSVVNKNVPPMTVVGGVPAKVIRPISPDNEKSYHPPSDM